MYDNKLYSEMHLLRIKNKIDYEVVCDALNIEMQFAQEIDAGYVDLPEDDLYKYFSVISGGNDGAKDLGFQ